MNIEIIHVRKIMVTEINGLDPIAIYLEDLGTGKGKIIITCYNQSWTSYWGGMGDRTISAFVKSCNNHYLAKNLSRIPVEIDDYDALKLDMLKKITEKRKTLELNELDARCAYGNIESYDAEELCKDRHDLLTLCYGDEWWYCIPKRINPEYVYLGKILTIVKDALIDIP
jgi:hypothetical protein